ncbi:DASS family sodium-coupled anion symporter [Puniceicoccaceae bacterium K14]|nr:DASS family sodium-coupled anion symporter [Puniceicoccaceae bacterium K14]
MNTKRKMFGLILSVAGLLMPIFFDIQGLDFVGEISLGIFVMAACLWIFEPIPIWATSLLVIFSQILLLSKEGPVYLFSNPDYIALEESVSQGEDMESLFAVPSEALEDEHLLLYDEEKRTVSSLEVDIIEDNGSIWISSEELAPGALIVIEKDHWKVTHEPIGFQNFYNTLAHKIIVLFLGGFFLAAGAVKFGLDKNLTRLMLRLFGTKSSFVVLGLLVATGVLSAFMSNTATTAMMITVVLPIISQLDTGDKLKMAVALAIPCGANIGGIATPIGTPPNAVVLSALSKQGFTIPFGDWVVLAFPIVAIMMFITWRLLLIFFPPKSKRLELKLEGGWNKSPKAIACYAIFGLTVLLWVTDKLHGVSSYMVAFLPIALMPLFGIIEKSDIKKFSWDVLWLMSGGIALGISMKLGPAEWLISLVDWSAFGAFGIIMVLGLVAYLVANVVSHTVAATILMPIAISLGTSGGTSTDFNYILACVTVGIMVSFSMLLPISTPPNAIAMSTGMIESKHLMRIGAVVGLIGYLLASLFGYFLWEGMLPKPF